jgi:hypothetical protein
VLRRDVASRLWASDRTQALSWCRSGWTCTASAPTWSPLDPTGEVVLCRRIGNAPGEFLRLVGELEPAPIEATYGWSWFADLLADKGVASREFYRSTSSMGDVKVWDERVAEAVGLRIGERAVCRSNAGWHRQQHRKASRRLGHSRGPHWRTVAWSLLILRGSRPSPDAITTPACRPALPPQVSRAGIGNPSRFGGSSNRIRLHPHQRTALSRPAIAGRVHESELGLVGSSCSTGDGARSTAASSSARFSPPGLSPR